jgi:hypothetical protein
MSSKCAKGIQLIDALMNRTALKQKVMRELADYWTNFLYLALFFSAFTYYRKLILAEYHIGYFHFGFALIEALVLAKVILLGDAMHLGRRMEEKPLILPTLYKAIIFTVWVGVFKLIEFTITGLLHRKGIAGGIDEFMRRGWDAFLAECLVVFFAFIPFFAFKELGRVLGERKVGELFFRKK